MTPRQLCEVLLKAIGVFSLLEGIKVALTLSAALFQNTGAPWDYLGREFFRLLPGYFIPISAPLIAAAALLYFSRPLSKWLIREEPTERDGGKLDRLTVWAIAFPIIGVYIIARNLPNDVATMVVLLRDLSEMNPDYKSMYTQSAMTSALRLVVSSAIGLYLIIGGEGLARKVAGLRRQRLPGE